MHLHEAQYVTLQDIILDIQVKSNSPKKENLGRLPDWKKKKKSNKKEMEVHIDTSPSIFQNRRKYATVYSVSHV